MSKKPKADFDFAAFLFLLERVLPERSKARKLLPQLENYVDSLRIGRPWETSDLRNGTSRDRAKTALFESIMKIPPEWRRDVSLSPVLDAISLDEVPEEVVREVEKLLERERNYCYVHQFITLRLKGDVVLTERCEPVPGTIHFDLAKKYGEQYGHVVEEDAE